MTIERPIPSWACRLELAADELRRGPELALLAAGLHRVSSAPFDADLDAAITFTEGYRGIAPDAALDVALEELRTGKRVEGWHAAQELRRQARAARQQQAGARA